MYYMVSKPKISVSSHSFGLDYRAGKMTFKDAVAFAADLGVDGIEIVSSQSFQDYPLSPRQLLDMKDYI